MSLFLKAIETYDNYFGQDPEFRNGKTMMAPVAHISTRAELEIVVDKDGNFIEAHAVEKTEPKIIIPATEGSAGRTSGPCPHPLCEQIGYLNPKNKKKFDLYVTQLALWEASEFSHPKLAPILRYVMSGNVISDLVGSNLIEVDEDEVPKDEKLLVRWVVRGEEPEACWLDHSLFGAFVCYYTSHNEGSKGFCILSGTETIIAEQHPKNIVPIYGNAKLISSADLRGFTYRGRFTESQQAASIGYEASQKAHNALRWLVQEQGVILAGRAFLCWNPNGKLMDPIHASFMQTEEPIFDPEEYRNELKKVLTSKRADLDVSDGVVLATFDAATTGRLALTYYSEMPGADFFQRIHDWDVSCCWPHWKFGIQSPSLRQIVDCAFGTQRNGRMETNEPVFRQQMQQLIANRVDRGQISVDIVKNLANRASRPQAYDHFVWETILFTACAVIRKYRNDRFKEEWSMALEPERKDRSYQFGRLLAIFEKAEKDTYRQGERREPTAIRLMSVFCQRPLATAEHLERHLEKAYFHKMNPGLRNWYKKQISDIMTKISEFPSEDWNKPLDNTRLMGYYLQREALYTKKTETTEEDNENV